MLIAMEPEPPFDPDEGVRQRGAQVQLGLTKDEIDDLEGRLKKLLEKIDQHEIALYEE
jgi:hypothetical protein